RLARAYADSRRGQLAARRTVEFSAGWGAGWLMPMGFEFGATRAMDPARDRPEDFARLAAEPPFDLSAQIAAANAAVDAAADTGAVAAMRRLSPPGSPAAAWLRRSRCDG